MPKVSEFFGISIYVYYRDHEPPHFHAVHGGDEALISIMDLSPLAGGLDPRSTALVKQWARIHQRELLAVWYEARAHQPLTKIDPLR